MNTLNLSQRIHKNFIQVAGMVLVAATMLILASCRPNEAPSKPADVDYYTCTMHPSVKSQDPKAKCPICSMDLVPVKKKANPADVPPAKSSANEEVQEQASDFTVPVTRQQQIGGHMRNG